MLRAIFAPTLFHVFVTGKLCFMFAIIFLNFFFGIAMVRILTGTQGRADGSNIQVQRPGYRSAAHGGDNG